MTSASNRASVLSGIGPRSPYPGRRRAVTRLEEHVIPDHLVQTEVAFLQLRRRAWGVEFAKSSSASRSELRSAVMMVVWSMYR